MKDKQEFIDAMDLQQDSDGHWHIYGTVEGDVGHVRGDADTVHGSVRRVEGDVWGYVTGSVGDVVGNVRRVEGDVAYVRGNVGVIVEGKINGREWEFVEENNDERA